MSNISSDPPGWPGIPARWTSSAKAGVGTAPGGLSRLWFAVSHGIVNEVYYPSFDTANVRDLGLLVTDRGDFFSEEKRDTASEIEMIAPGVPGFHLQNTCNEGRYRVEKQVIADPLHDVLLQKIRVVPLLGTIDDYSVFALLSPHIGNRGAENNGWSGEYKGVPMMFAQRDDICMAFACSRPFLKRSCGYVGFSDGWQDLRTNKRLTHEYARASNGNLALTAELDLSEGDCVLALGFGHSPEEAALQARSSLIQPFDNVAEAFILGWTRIQDTFLPLEASSETDCYRVSTSVLHVHQSKDTAGGMIASLSIPWGASKGDDELGGYHLVWPRDLCESAGALLAAGDTESAGQCLTFLMATQEADGHWPQNMWHTGLPFWTGIQMDETAFPILLADALRRAGALDGTDVWPMVSRAASFIAVNGPVTDQDRWEEDGGYSTFTLAVEVAALLAAAGFADDAGATEAAEYLRETADIWNSSIERWTYVSDTDIARDIGVDGYYVRISPPDDADGQSISQGFIPIKNRPPATSTSPSIQIVSPDALALVRFGLRSPHDQRIENTVRVIDALLKTESATGPIWHRYNDDGYGEHEDGSPFNGTGIGRGWPLLAGERAHYELTAGNEAEARRLLSVIEAQTSPGGLMPEQVWDAADIPERELFNGKPSGSAMPLVWAHAEHVKLLRSLRDGRIFDTPDQTVRRYIDAPMEGQTNKVPWRTNHKCRSLVAGQTLRIELRSPALIHWSTDAWQSVVDSHTSDSRLGIHYVDLPTSSLSAGTSLVFTILWEAESRWEGVDYTVAVA